MAFGITGLRKIKEESKNKLSEKFYKNIVVGSDISAVLAFLELRKHQEPEQLAWILSEQESKESIESRFNSSIHQIRDEESARILNDKFSNLILKKNTHPPVFYKDTEFKEFGGRSRPPMKLQGNEKFFASHFYHVELTEVLNSLDISSEDWEKLDEYIALYRLDKEILKIKSQAPTDLIRKDCWNLSTKDNFALLCENLIWSKGAKSFLSLYSDKASLPEELVQSFESIKTLPGYSVCFEVDSKVFEEDQTVFLPQSLTHEWGHFIGEFSSFDEENKKQKFTFQAEVHDEEINSEDLAKKIKLLKRTLKRIFDSFKTEVSESIYFSEDMFVGEIEDEKFISQIYSYFPNLYLIGHAAPIKKVEPTSSKGSISYLTRTLLSVNELKNNSIHL